MPDENTTVVEKTQDRLPADTPASGQSLDDIARGLGDIQRRKIEATEKTYGDIETGLERTQAEAERRYKEAGASANDPALKPWDAEAEAAKRQTDPIQAFGSLGSVFGILASAFTHAPMVNALNASAAAINAVKEGNQKDYERAYKAWQDNSKLALERHNLQQQAYKDALELMRTNLEVGRAKLQVQAARFDDRKAMFLLDHGLDKEVFDLMAAREKLASQLVEQQPKMWLANAQMSFLMNSGYDFKNPANPQNARVLQEFRMQFGEGKADGDRVFIEQWLREHPEASSEDFAKAFGDYKQKISPKFGIGGVTTTERSIARDAETMVEQYKKEHPDASASELADYRAQVTKRLRTESAAPSGTRIDELKGKVNQVKLARGIVDEIDGLLLKHKAITGIGGKITRPAEVIANVLGASETDRKQFERFVSELQMMAPRILLDSHGRPLSAEAGHVAAVIAGLRPGDTGPNTIRAYIELRKQLDEIESGLQSRMGAGGRDEAAPARVAPAASKWWESAPVVGQ